MQIWGLELENGHVFRSQRKLRLAAGPGEVLACHQLAARRRGRRIKADRHGTAVAAVVEDGQIPHLLATEPLQMNVVITGMRLGDGLPAGLRDKLAQRYVLSKQRSVALVEIR